MSYKASHIMHDPLDPCQPLRITILYANKFGPLYVAINYRVIKKTIIIL